MLTVPVTVKRPLATRSRIRPGLKFPASRTGEPRRRDHVRVAYSTSMISALLGPWVVDIVGWPAAASWT
ncbi:MAG: hypothetical protein ACYCVZ_06810 [Streptosporangiaceae bacterium]